VCYLLRNQRILFFSKREWFVQLHATTCGDTGSKEKRSLGGDAYSAPAVYVKEGGGSWNIYYICRDYLGSITHVVNAAGSLTQELSYDPWGRLRNTSTQVAYTPDTELVLFLGRGYTGHEHLTAFGLINMNARLYDPAIGRFLSPDPYVQAPDFSQNFNRYSYCVNNPLKFTDENGEFWHIVIGALIGGIANLVATWNSSSGFWEHLAAFSVGAAAGAATAATGGAAGATWAGVAGVSAAGGAAVASTNSVIAQTGTNFSGIDKVNWGQVAGSGLVGGFSGFAGGAAGYWASNATFLVNNVSSPLLRSAVVSLLAAGAGHVAGGTALGIMNGQNVSDAFSNSFKGMGTRMAVGRALGVATCYANGVNPLNGEMMWPKNNGFTSEPEISTLQPGSVIDRFGDENGNFASPVGTSFNSRSLPINYSISKDYNIYQVVKPIPVYQGTAAPSFWFNSSGGATQYMFLNKIDYYINNGYLIKQP